MLENGCTALANFGFEILLQVQGRFKRWKGFSKTNRKCRDSRMQGYFYRSSLLQEMTLKQKGVPPSACFDCRGYFRGSLLFFRGGMTRPYPQSFYPEYPVTLEVSQKVLKRLSAIYKPLVLGKQKKVCADISCIFAVQVYNNMEGVHRATVHRAYIHIVTLGVLEVAYRSTLSLEMLPYAGEERYKAVLGVLQFWGVNAEMLSNCKRRAGGLEDHRDKSRCLSGPHICLPSQSNRISPLLYE
ncbi:hypothetical protein J6590_052959 [Homalodisca vitripennis]|nr:hypothetical protein J6590_052959 [Homalodisca vitripennis]